jgi:hypothetical protein
MQADHAAVGDDHGRVHMDGDAVEHAIGRHDRAG